MGQSKVNPKTYPQKTRMGTRRLDQWKVRTWGAAVPRPYGKWATVRSGKVWSFLVAGSFLCRGKLGACGYLGWAVG